MDKKTSYYQLFHVQPDAPVEIVQSSYRAMMQKLKQHPDLGGDPKHAALLNKAYDVLSNPKKRQAYDRSLSAENIVISTKHPHPHPQNHTCLFCLANLSAANTPAPTDHCYKCESPLKFNSYQTINDLSMGSQRAITRFKKEANIFIHPQWPSHPKKAKLLDLSLAGLKFGFVNGLAIDKYIKINAPFLSAVARITHCGKTGTSIYQIGAEFITLEFIDKSGTFISESI